MGTRFELVLSGGPRDLLAAGEAALDEIIEWHGRLSRFAPDSLVSHINRTAAHTPVRLDRETFMLFEDALAVWRASGGAFDITMGPLMARHGFGDSAVAASGQLTSSAGIVLDPAAWTIRFTTRDISLDLGGIAKGHALDCAAALLRRHGVTCALLHGGTSSVVAIGTPPGSSGWSVAIARAGRAGVVSLKDAALGVSCAVSHTTSDAAGHIMDPRTGEPVVGRHLVAVVGPSARLADAWATALVVSGRPPDAFPGDYQVALAQAA